MDKTERWLFSLSAGMDSSLTYMYDKPRVNGLSGSVNGLTVNMTTKRSLLRSRGPSRRQGFELIVAECLQGHQLFP